MISNPRVNRYLKDKAMDHIDHALGRPVDPTGETYRNHFATGVDSQEAKAFGASENWELDGLVRGMAYFSVTGAGRKALADHLKAIGDPWRPYAVEWNEETCIYAATSESDAKKRAYSSASDVFSDLTFRKFDREASVMRLGA
ncbi:hypothetical protein [Sinorhizobium meliloti]|uniref:hypothetical protein n=1 Tax=Rhizobium meliloti TaxID=382 RepID=UPI000FD9865D|nr:hypothetical protein [Sinorhizobium meliloti]RVO30333.1 hypothetical protein CN095_23745 [Sinorhizobium meliloti]